MAPTGTDKELESLIAAGLSNVALPTIEIADDLDRDALAEAYDTSFKNLSEGEVIPGTVIEVSDSHVLVDIGFKSEGLVPIGEFRERGGVVNVKAGDTVDVLMENSETLDGGVILSREKAERMKIWDSIERAYQEQAVIQGRVIERVKGGLSVDIGVRAFLPGSQVDMHPVRNLDSLRDQELQLRVIKVNKRRGNIVLSRKAVLEEEYFKRKEETLRSLEEGKVTPGVVKNITDYGAFVDLGGIDGLLHITDMSCGRSTTLPTSSRSETRSTSRFSSSTESTRRSPWDTSSSPPIPGTPWPNGTRAGPASLRWSSASPTTAPSSNWRRVSRDSFTFPK